MPLDRVDQLPLPSLHWFAAFSGLALSYATVYALTAQDGLFGTLFSDVWCTAAILNMLCCCFFLLAKFIYSIVFGALQRVEEQHMRDKFWNFVFYRFIFVFGVMNVQEMQEMLCWCVWFAVLGTLLLTEQLCKDRFQFLSFSPNTPASSHAKIIILLSTVILCCAGLFMVCAIVGWQFGFNHFTFLFSEVFILFARTLHTIIRYIIHLWDMHHDGTWENRNTYTYYTELVLELAALCVDFMHHVHMLLWANMFLSVASLILLMKLRFLYQEIQHRLKRHRNYVLVSRTLESMYVQVPPHELFMSDEVCAICWEKMNSACRLPCGHHFHMGCLRSWLEQDTVCPTCRRSLSQDLASGQGQGAETAEGRRGQARRSPRNWLLHFNGASIASWLPTFSLELHQEDTLINDTAALHRGAQQVHSMFPHIPLQAITLDLADTHSVSLTVDRVLNNTIYIPEQHQQQQNQQHNSQQQQLLPFQGGEGPTTSEPHPLMSSQQQPHASSLHHGSSTEGDSMYSSDQEATTCTTGSNTSSRDSSETPPEEEEGEEQGSMLSTSRETESDNTHSDSSALELEEEGEEGEGEKEKAAASSGTFLRRRKRHHHRRHHRKIETSTESSVCSSTDTTGTAADTVSVSSSSDGRAEAMGEDRIGLALSTPNRQTENFGAQLLRSYGGRVDLGYTGPAGLASLEHQRRGGLGSHHSLVSGGGGGGGLGTFSSLQQRKEDMLKKAREQYRKRELNNQDTYSS